MGLPVFIRNSNEITPMHKLNHQCYSSSFESALNFQIYLTEILCMVPFFRESLKWNSLKVLSASAVFCGQIVMVILTIWLVNREGLSLHRAGCILFFSGAAAMMLFMIQFMYRWPKLMKKWKQVESYFGYQDNLKIIFASISTLITIFSTDLIFIGIFIMFSEKRITGLLEMYTVRTFPQVFEVMEYTIWRAIPVIYVNAVSLLLYSFADQFIIIISLALGNYFGIYYRRVLSSKQKWSSESYWKIFREQYTKLFELSSAVDDCLCHLLCLTFVMHLYILCVMMREGFFFQTSDVWEKIHAILALSSSILRAFGLCYSTVRVHEESKLILNVLYAVPSFSYCNEVELFMQQVLESDISLTGSHVFSMKRKFLLTIGGAIVSSQILLSQIKDFKPTTRIDVMKNTPIRNLQ